MSWCKAIPISEFPADEVAAVSCKGRDIAIYRTADGFFATADLCTHARARMSEGYLEGHVIECPLHGARFDVRTGAVMSPPATMPLATYRTSVDQDWVIVDIPDAE